MINFAKRNLKIFFRDKSTVFFSLLAVFIIIGLYALFLGEQLVKGMEEIENARFLMDSWIMAGLLAVTPVSATLGSFGTMVDDKTKKIYKDFACSPISPGKLAGGYILSSFCVGVILSVIAFILSEIYVVANGGTLMSALSMLKIFGVIVLTVLASSAMMYFIVSFFKSSNAFSTASTVIGTLIGFVTGIYLPIGSVADGLQYVIEFFPISHAASLFRKIFMEEPMAKGLDGAPEAYITEFKIDLGIEFQVGDFTFSSFDSILYLLATAAIFYILGIIVTARKKKK